jgi:hypothetical protein
MTAISGGEVKKLAITYEAPGCQESKISRQRVFAFFPVFLMLASLAIGSVS